MLTALAVAGVSFIAYRPIIGTGEQPLEFTIKPGSSVRSTAGQIADAGLPLNPLVFEVLARATGKAPRLKAGHYEVKPGTTPLALIDQLVRGEFAQEALAVIEGWSFRQMRQAIAAHPALKHDTAALSDKELLAKITTDHTVPEGLFFPDTYRFAKGSSDLQIYKQAYGLLQKRLNEA